MVSVAAGQIPISWSVPGNVQVIKAVIGEVELGALLVLPEAAISGYDDTLSGLDDLDPQELAEAYRSIPDAATAGVSTWSVAPAARGRAVVERRHVLRPRPEMVDLPQGQLGDA